MGKQQQRLLFTKVAAEALPVLHGTLEQVSKLAAGAAAVASRIVWQLQQRTAQSACPAGNISSKQRQLLVPMQRAQAHMQADNSCNAVAARAAAALPPAAATAVCRRRQ